MPLALSKSSLSAISPNGRPSTPVSQRYSISSFATTAPSIKSVPSSFTNRSSPRSPGSYNPPALYHSHLTQRSPTLPRHIFETLPPEIYDTILRQLRTVHENPVLGSCQTCYLRDLCALSLTSRAWDKAVVKRMYAGSKDIKEIGANRFAVEGTIASSSSVTTRKSK